MPHGLASPAYRRALLALAVALAAAGLAVGAGLGAPAAATAGSPRAATVAQNSIVDSTWVGGTTGWVLSAVPCSQGSCPRLYRTEDGGRTWVELPDPPARLTGAACTALPCVAHVRFASASLGYLFGPSLLMTRNGGLTWSLVRGPMVESLEPGSGSVVRIVYDHVGCPGPCHSEVEVAVAGSGHWRVVLASLPATAEEAASAQVIRVGPSTVYVPVYGNLASGVASSQRTSIFRSLDGGTTWSRLGDPCGGSGKTERDTVALAAAPGGFLAALCTARSGAHANSVVTSTNEGSSWGPRRAVAGLSPAIASLIATPADGVLVVSNSLVGGAGPDSYQLSRSSDDGRSWETVAIDREHLIAGAPFASSLSFEDASLGHWVDDPNAIWTSVDEGRRWTRRTFP